MLGGVKFKRDPDSWLGLIDGIYAVSMTYLIISSPAAFKVFLEKIFFSSPRFDSPLQNLFDSATKVSLILVFLLMILGLFILLVDTWSLQRRQIQYVSAIDQQHCFYLALGLICAVFLPALVLIRMDDLGRTPSPLEVTATDWLIVFSLITLYFELFLAEKRQYFLNAARQAHRKKRISFFSFNIIRRRLMFSIGLVPFFLYLRLIGSPFYIAALYIPILSTAILLESSSRARILRRFLRNKFYHLLYLIRR